MPFFCIHISQGSVATCLKRGKIFKHEFVANLLPSRLLKKFWKSVSCFLTHGVETYAIVRWTFDVHLTANLPRNLPVKKIHKSVKNLQNCGHESVAPFFGPPCICFQMLLLELWESSDGSLWSEYLHALITLGSLRTVLSVPLTIRLYRLFLTLLATVHGASFSF